MKKKMIAMILIAILTLVLGTGCGEKTYDELVQEATYGGSGEYNTDNYADDQPEYQPSYNNYQDEEEEELEPMTNPLVETDSYEYDDEYENFGSDFE